MQPHTPAPASDPTDVLGRRIVAWLIEFTLISIILFVIALSTFTNTEFASNLTAERQCDVINDTTSDACIVVNSTIYVGESDTVGRMALVTGVYALVVTVLMPGLTGWSPGKKLMGLRVVNQESFELAGMGPNIGRGFFWIVDSFPWFVPFVGFISGVASNGHRRVGDRVAKTLVVDKSLVGHPMHVAGVNRVAPSTVTYPAPPPTNLPQSPPVGGLSSPPPSTGDPFKPPEPPDSTQPSSPPSDSAPPQPGVEAPKWDTARNTYIQWDPELSAWMEWNEPSGRWVPISQ